jgi:hypothetical protein
LLFIKRLLYFYSIAFIFVFVYHQFMINKKYYTSREIADILGIKIATVLARISRLGIKPIKLIGTIGLYPKDTLEKINSIEIQIDTEQKEPPTMQIYDTEECYTARQMADILGIKFEAVRSRITKSGVKPAKLVGRIGLYTREALEKIRFVKKNGRPRIDTEQKESPTMQIYDTEEYYTVRQMADILGIRFSTARTRVSRLGLKPIKLVGTIGLYPKDTLEKINSVPSRGRPSLDTCAEKKAGEEV